MNTPLGILITTFPATGHLNPALPVARAMVERGHNVRWYTGRDHRTAIEATGATFKPIVAGPRPADQPFQERLPDRAALEGGCSRSTKFPRPAAMGSASARTLPVRLDRELRQALNERGAAGDTTVSEVVREALRRYLKAG